MSKNASMQKAMNKAKKQQHSIKGWIIFALLIATPIHLYMKDFGILASIGLTLAVLVVLCLLKWMFFRYVLLALPVYAFVFGGLWSGVVTILLMLMLMLCIFGTRSKQ